MTPYLRSILHIYYQVLEVMSSERQISVSVPVSVETFGLNHNRSFGLVLAVILVLAEILVQNTTENRKLKAENIF
jgi:hypothetical protein